jgi:hypothetical protein
VGWPSARYGTQALDVDPYGSPFVDDLLLVEGVIRLTCGNARTWVEVGTYIAHTPLGGEVRNGVRDGTGLILSAERAHQRVEPSIRRPTSTYGRKTHRRRRREQRRPHPTLPGIPGASLQLGSHLPGRPSSAPLPRAIVPLATEAADAARARWNVPRRCMRELNKRVSALSLWSASPLACRSFHACHTQPPSSPP